MAFQEGQSGNPNGRPKGSKNKASAEIKTLMEGMITENADSLRTTFKALKGKNKIKAFTDMLPYILPKQQSISAAISLDKLTDDQLDQLIDHLQNKNLNDE